MRNPLELSRHQAWGSAMTSRRQLPAPRKRIHWEQGTRNLDVGGGKYDDFSLWLRRRGVENLIFDPFNRPMVSNVLTLKASLEGVETATLFSVLNVIASPEARLFSLLLAASRARSVFVWVHEGDRSGRPSMTRDGFQLNRPAADYEAELDAVFDRVICADGLWACCLVTRWDLSQLRQWTGGY